MLWGDIIIALAVLTAIVVLVFCIWVSNRPKRPAPASSTPLIPPPRCEVHTTDGRRCQRDSHPEANFGHVFADWRFTGCPWARIVEAGKPIVACCLPNTHTGRHIGFLENGQQVEWGLHPPRVLGNEEVPNAEPKEET